MRSSSGQFFIGLDHVRALAAFMVVTWHFTHGPHGFPIPFEYAPMFFPLSVLDEGHTGVALFMCLSGYLFAKLLDGKKIHYPSFFWNRALRLLPLLAVVIGIDAILRAMSGENLAAFAEAVMYGIVFPTLPNGGWSITAEAHFYIILPLLLWLARKSKFLPLAIVAMALALRAWIFLATEEIQPLAYLTIVGRIDQFVLGVVAYQFRSLFTRRHLLVAGVLLSFCLFYWYYDLLGGFFRSGRRAEFLWIFIPTIEGLAYAVGIAWYDTSFTFKTTGLSGLVGKLGAYSYSIYLLHLFIVFQCAWIVQTYVMDLTNFYVACAWSLVFFLMMLPIGALSFRFIEGPFLKLRRQYIVERTTLSPALSQGRG